MRNEGVVLGKFKHIVVPSRDYPRDYLDIKYIRKAVIRKRTALRQAIVFLSDLSCGYSPEEGNKGHFFQINLVRRDLQSL